MTRYTFSLYFYTFLILDSIQGFLLKYLNLDLFLNPGQIIRGLFLILLFIVFLKDIQKRIRPISKYYILLICFFGFFLVVLFFRFFSLSRLLDESTHIFKILFILFLIYYVFKHHEYFLNKLDKIIRINFIVFSFFLILGYITHKGLTTYSYIESTSKGFFYGGNPVSILSLVFFTYYLFKFRFRIENILFVCIALFNIHIISTKAVLIVPLIFMLYLLDKFFRERLSKKVTFAFFLIPFFIASFFLVGPEIIDIYESRYSKVVERSYRTFQRRERVFESPITAPLEMIAYRRPMAAKIQFSELLEKPSFLFLGFGKTGQEDFWIKRESPYHNASMDFFDVIFQYGIFGGFLIYVVIFSTVFKILLNIQTDRNSIIVILIFLYSFFGGHVIASTTSGTMLALFIGIKYGEFEVNRKKGKHVFNRINKKFSWLKK